MLAEFITNTLVVVFGYTYPAFECFKAVEEYPGKTEQLRFWCQYWIIVAIITSVEKFADPVISLLPMYGEVKLAFLVYLWYPKTKGTDVVYDTFLRPFVMQYEPNIEDRFRHLRAKSGEFLMFYLKNFTEKGPTLFVDTLRFVVSQASQGTEKIKRSSSIFSRSSSRQPEYEDPSAIFYADRNNHVKQRKSRK